MADNEYAIWRAIGILTQRVRDLEQPTPAPEPPKAYEKCMCGHDIALHSTQFGRCAVKGCNCTRPKPIPTLKPEAGVSNGQNTIWHDPEVRMVDGIDKCPMCLGTGKVVRLEPVKTDPEAIRPEAIDEVTRPLVFCESCHTSHKVGKHLRPEASQPLPAEVEAVFKDARSKLLSGPVTRIWTSDALDIVIAIQQRLASLWPKAGQVPSVPFTELELRDKLFSAPANNVDDLARLMYPWLISRTIQPSPVTAEKLAKWLKKYDKETEEQVVVHYSAMAEALLQAFPTLGQGRLTRDAVKIDPKRNQRFWQACGWKLEELDQNEIKMLVWANPNDVDVRDFLPSPSDPVSFTGYMLRDGLPKVREKWPGAWIILYTSEGEEACVIRSGFEMIALCKAPTLSEAMFPAFEKAMGLNKEEK